MEEDKRDLERQVNELKAKIDQIEKRNAEQRAAEEKKHAEDITFYKKTNQQLKVINFIYLLVQGPIFSKFYSIKDSIRRNHCTKKIKNWENSSIK